MFVALIAAAGALVLWGVWHATPLGRVTRQIRNRRQLRSASDLVCPIHGEQAAADMVRLSDGTRVCPTCFQETVNGKLD